MSLAPKANIFIKLRKMIRTAISITMLITALAATKAKHPLKIAVLLLLFSIPLIISMRLRTAITIFPQIYFIIFAGGILVLMLVLAALSPNQKIANKKNIILSLLVTLAITTTVQTRSQETPLKNINASMLENSENFLFLIIIILVYF